MRRGAAELGGDLIAGVTFHAEDHHLAENVVVEPFEQPTILLGDHGGKLGGRLGGESPGQHVVVRVVFRGGKIGGPPHLPAATLLTKLPARLGLDFPGRDHHEQPPEIVAIGQVGEPAPRQPVQRLSNALSAASSSSLLASL